jgi:L-gulono-1,4-lactone dehydrogenase
MLNRLPPRSTAAWQNWSGNVRAAPAYLVRPRDEVGVAAAVVAAARHGQTVRAAGAGHSFNPLACTDGLLLDLRSYAGVVRIDRDAAEVTVRPGTSLRRLTMALDHAGLALANLGTLTSQTVAGALSTGTHGTGARHRPFAGQVSALRLVIADGSVLTLGRDSDPDIFRCARTALGALGIISEVTLSCVASFNLRVAAHAEPLEGLLDRFSEWAVSADHVAFCWQPWDDRVLVRSLSRSAEPRTPGAARHRYLATMSEARCAIAGLAGRRKPAAVPWLAGRVAGPGQAAAHYVDASYRAFTFPQPVKFLAMEHALPLENIPSAVRALRGALRRAGRRSPYSVLVRVGAPDDSPLSPAYGRPTGYLNLTVPRTAGYIELLRVAEHVARELDGRPHWAKAHTATAELLEPRYPEWSTFQRVRAQLDPAGLFSNDYVERVLGRSVQVPAAALKAGRCSGPVPAGADG